MQNMHVTLLNATTFEAVVDNEIVAKEFISMTPQLQEYLRTRLKNRKVTMSVRISTPTEKVRAYGRVEKIPNDGSEKQCSFTIERRIRIGTLLSIISKEA